jgi:cyanophycinase-like exopeptidase
LPTAAGTEGDAMIDSWMQRGVAHFQRLGATATGVRVHDRATALDATHAARVRQANFVYLSGGKPSYLYDTLVDTPVWAAIVSVHQNGGVVAGCSAGAMIMGSRIGGPGGGGKGFSLLPDTAILPHYDEFPGIVGRVMRWFSGANVTMVGIDGNTALLHSAAGYEVAGLGGVTILNSSGNTRYTSGPLPPHVLAAPDDARHD